MKSRVLPTLRHSQYQIWTRKPVLMAHYNTRYLMLWVRQNAVDVEGETLVKFETIIKFFTSLYFNLYFHIKVKHMKLSGTHHIIKEKTPEV